MALAWKLQTPFFKCHGKPLERAAIIQGLALMMTGGVWEQDLHRFIVLGCIAYWLPVFLIMVRREDCLSRADCILMDWGWVPMIFALVIYTFGFAHL